MTYDTVDRLCDDVIQGPSVSGGWFAILETTGIDIRCLPNVMDGSGTSVVMHNGHEWTIKPWLGGGGFAVASRPRTEEEEEQANRRTLRRTYASHFTQDRLEMCMDIAEQVTALLAQMRPDHPPSRAVRRDVHRKLNRLAEMLTPTEN